MADIISFENIDFRSWVISAWWWESWPWGYTEFVFEFKNHFMRIMWKNLQA
jgi:hypothetical protein